MRLPTGVNIRLFSQKDSSTFLTAYRHCFSEQWEEGACRALLTKPHVKIWLAMEGDEVIGFIVISQAEDEAEIVTIGVVLEHRKQGVASQLLERALQGMKHCFLEVSVENSMAYGFYQQHGFVEVGRRKDYYREGDRRVDAVIMEKLFYNVPCSVSLE